MKLPGQVRSAVAAFSVFLPAANLCGQEPELTNTTSFRIPFAVESTDGQMPDGYAMLFGGRDSGPLEQLQRVPVAAGEFQFTAPTDGTWQFAVRMSDSSGAADPAAGPVHPELEVIVDTTPPELQLSINDTGQGTAQVVWSISEEISLGTLSMEYAEGADGRWKPLPVTPTRFGQTVVRARPGMPVVIRAQVTDVAGNTCQSIQQALLSACKQPTVYPGAASAGQTAHAVHAWTSVAAAPEAMGPSPFGPPPVRAANVGFGAQGPDSAWPPVGNAVAGRTGGLPFSPGTSNALAPVPVQPYAGNGLPTALGGLAPADTAVPAHQLVSSPVFNLAYQVEGVGLSGVSAVELFLTEDNGRKWYRYGNDTDLKNPMLVDVQGEGTFGFAIRVKNGAGFSDPPPQPGEDPEIVVTVDQTPPAVEIALPEAQSRGNGVIHVRWSLREQADIRLEYAASSAGPWIPLFDWQADRTSYEWSIRPNLPPGVYFRVLARDAAGNIASAQTVQPTVIDLQCPKVRMLGVQPAALGDIGY